MIGKILKIIGFLVVACVVLGVIASIAQRGQPSTPTTKSAENAQVKLAVTMAATSAPAAQVGAQAAVQAAPVEPTQAPEPTAAPAKLAGIGERVVSGGIALTVVNVERKAQINKYLDAKEGMEFVIIEALIENVERDEAPYNGLYFKVKDQDGFEYTTAFGAPDPSLKSGKLTKGDKARGMVAFEVKKGASGLVVSYEPMVLFGGYETIRVALG